MLRHPHLSSSRSSDPAVVCLQAQAHFPVQDLSWVGLQLDALGRECVTRLQQAGALPGSLQVRGEAVGEAVGEACIHILYLISMSCEHHIQLLEVLSMTVTEMFHALCSLSCKYHRPRPATGSMHATITGLFLTRQGVAARHSHDTINVAVSSAVGH